MTNGGIVVTDEMDVFNSIRLWFCSSDMRFGILYVWFLKEWNGRFITLPVWVVSFARWPAVARCWQMRDAYFTIHFNVMTFEKVWECYPPLANLYAGMVIARWH